MMARFYYFFSARHGQGKAYHDNGELVYDGEWKNGEYWGRGKKYNRYGELIYEGEFANGEWKAGKPSGRGKNVRCIR
jgi:antitoxin component YwqK of YwqJK toxin-antitoxin module